MHYQGEGVGVGARVSVQMSVWAENRVWVLYLLLIRHTLTHPPNPQLPTNSFSAMYFFGKIGIGNFVVDQNGLISSLLIHENYIFFVEEDKYVRSNRSNIEFPFIIALECVFFDLKATRLKIPPACEK
jgi:hypothetical protein